MAVVTHPNGKYRAEVYVAGERRKGPLRKLKREAKADEEQLLNDLRAKQEIAARRPEDLVVDMTVGAWVDQWMPSQKWARGTRSNYEHAWSLVPASFKATLLVDVTPRLYDLAIHKIELEGNRRKAHQLIGKSFKRAVLHGYMQSSPTTVVSVPMPKAPEVIPPSKAEVKLLIGKASTETWRVFFHVAATTGMRRGELCGLRWDDLDEDHIRVRRTVWQDNKTRTHGIAEPKGRTERSRRTLAVDAETMKLLRLLPRESKYVFAGDHGDGYRLPGGATKAFAEAAKAAELPNTTLHDLRHYHASVLIAAGIDIVAVSRRLGHASVTTTLNTYGHLVKGRDDGSAAAAAL